MNAVARLIEVLHGLLELAKSQEQTCNGNNCNKAVRKAYKSVEEIKQ